jgi:hypothetical protein
MRIELPSRQADGSTPNYVVVKDPDDFLAADLFALHRQIRFPTTDNGTYSPREVDDDYINAFLGTAITEWSFPAPVPSQNNIVAADVTIGRTMKARDWGVLQRKVRPLLAELEGAESEAPKETGTGSASSSS